MDSIPALTRSMALVAATLLAPTQIPLANAQAEPEVTLLIPAYFYPTWWSGSPWDDLNEAAPDVPIEAIMNPASGPGLGPNPDYMTAVSDFRDAGGKVIGYVPTGFGARSVQDVIRDVEAYLAWYTVDGIFLDEMGNQFGPLDYQAVHDAIKAFEGPLGRDLRVVGNPGLPFLQVEGYLDAADTLVIYEGPLSNPDLFGASFEAYPDRGPYAGLPQWFRDYDSDRFANLIYGVPTPDKMFVVLDKALRTNAGSVYVTDDDISAFNPWDTLPSYWDWLVDAVEMINASP